MTQLAESSPLAEADLALLGLYSFAGEDFLEHYGRKGMRWGVRNDEKPSGRKSSSKNESSAPKDNPYALNDNDRAILRGAKLDESDSETVKAKYGPGTLGGKKDNSRFTQDQKDAAIAIVTVLGVAAGAWYLYHKVGQLEQNEYFKRINPVAKQAESRNLSAFRREWNTYIGNSQLKSAGLSKEFVNKLSDEPTNLKAGTIFKRVSTERETSIRPGGFYAAHKDEDVNRYKAMLPVFWKSWGRPANAGYVVNLKANADIKAPSPKKTFEKFRDMLNDNVSGSDGLPSRKLRDYYPGNAAGGDDDTVARRLFPHFSVMWANESHPGTKHFFGKLKDEGFNAVVDMNDAGSLASKPMRLLDGNLFSIAGHDRLSSNGIASAQESIKALAHAFMAMAATRMAFREEYLLHAGVKGMKWGRRKAKPPPNPRTRARNEAIVKAAIAVGVVAVAAILYKRGGGKFSSPASKKIALAGAKTSINILTKTGRVMATTSVKLGNTVGKTAVKTTTKVGTVAGKGVYKGGIAGSKAAGRAIAQNGSKVYERVIKKSALSTMRLASHASYKFTGRGTPIVKEVAKRNFFVSPTDLLLNVRADKFRGR